MKTIKIILLGTMLMSAQVYAQWNLLGNTGTNDPAVPATYGTSTIGGTENWVGTTDAQDVVIGTNTIERFRIKKSTGNVGIGTAAPTQRLHVSNGNVMLDYASVGTTGNLYFGAQIDNGFSNGLRLFATSTSSYIDSRNSTSTNGLIFRVNTTDGGTERMRICANGNIGINTTNPLYKLHISGDLFVTGNSNNATVLYGDNTQPEYGTEYHDPATGVSGLNFWKPWNSHNGAGGQGFLNYILYLNDDGNVGIGVDPDKINSAYKLSVNGSIRAEEVVVETGWADFVFEPGYQLMKLDSLEDFVKANHHLPGVPTAAEVETNGVKVGETEAKLLEKIEELTLYVIELNKKIEILENKSQN